MRSNVREEGEPSAAWMMRLNTGDGDVTGSAIRDETLILGWSEIQGPDADEGYWAFRDRVKVGYYPNDSDFRRAGKAAGALWKFYREFQVGDLVLVPQKKAFLAARISGENSEYWPSTDGTDMAHRRAVEWLRGAEEFPRTTVQADLRRRLKYRGTIASVSEHLDEIVAVVSRPVGDKIPTFKAALAGKMAAAALEELSRGYIEDYGFEILVQIVFTAMGADRTDLVARKLDKGSDLLVDFSLHGYLRRRGSVQVKHWDDTAGREPVDQVLRGMNENGSDAGIVITTASFSREARDLVAEIAEDSGKLIELIDGDDLAGLVVDIGLENLEIKF
jgi:predicted Mrr-cat superfamily restriction endonuclease